MNNKKHIVKAKDINFEHKNLKWYYFIPLLIIIAIIPIVARGKYIELEGIQALFWKGREYHVDVYSYWKSFWLIFTCILSIIFYIALRVDKKLPFKTTGMLKYYIPLGIYAIFIIISSVTSYYPEVVYGGFVDLYQGMFVLLVYVSLTFLLINYVNNENDIKLFSKAFIFLIIVEGIIGIGQYFGADIIKSEFGINLIMPNELIIEKATHIFDKYTIYGTMYNTNFVGSFAAVIIPLSIAFYVNSDTIKSKIICGLVIFLSACLWIGCNSRAGYIGLISAGIITAVLLRKQIVRNYKFVLTLLAGLLTIVLVFNFVSGGRILSQFSRLNIFKEVDKIEQINTQTESVVFKDIKLEENYFSIITNLETLTVKYENNDFTFLDENSNELTTLIDEDGYVVLENEKYKNYKMIPDNESVSIDISAHNRIIGFYFTQSGVKILGCGNRLTEPVVAPTFRLLNGYDRFASGRGYIWSRSIMMLPDVLLKGHGPDTYAIAFPQDDFMAKLNAGWNATMIVDKPHNMFLQIAINTGVISLIALLVLWAIYIFTGFKLYFKMEYNTNEKCMGFACMMSVIAYLAAGMFNDQIVSVAPLFWITLGMGISINERLKNKEVISKLK